MKSKEAKMLIEIRTKTYLLLVIVLSVSQLINAQRSRCNPTLCDCSNYLEDEYSYQNLISCPPNNPTVRFEIRNYTGETHIQRLGHPFIKAFIYCDTNDQLVFDVIAQTNVEYFDSVKYITCPVPFNSSLADGMPILDELIFDNDAVLVYNEWKPVHFSGLTNLRSLTIETETLDQLPNWTFEGSSKLKDVTLKMKRPNLQLFTLADEVLLGFLDGDKLNGSLIPANNNVKHLNIFYAELHPLTRNVMEEFSEVESILLNDNTDLSFNSDCLSTLVNLKKISFIKNKIKAFPQGIFNENKKLTEILIQSEKMKSLPDGIFSGLPQLHRVSIVYSKLKEIPSNAFENSVNIQELDFTSSKLVTLPHGLFTNLHQLRKLILADNKITSLPHGLFDDLSKLEILDLSRNRLKSIAAANINVASYFLSIDLSSNEIKDITVDDLHLFEKNTTVNLGSNEISAFSGIVQLRKHIGRYSSTVNLRENPFDCRTCDIFHVVQERGEAYDDPDDFVTKPFNIDTNDLLCSQPQRLSWRPVRHLDFSNYTCSLSDDNNFRLAD